MKKRILSFCFALVMILGIVPCTGLNAEETDVEVNFGKFLINKDYITSAQIYGAGVASVTQLDTAPEKGETNRLHYRVELSSTAKDGDELYIRMAASEYVVSGIGSALKAEKVGSVFDDEHDLDYYVTIAEGKAQMKCYSYYQRSNYTTLVIDFVIGDTEIPYDADPYNVSGLGYGWGFLNSIDIWGADVMKESHFTTVNTPTGRPDIHTQAMVYLWLDPETSDDATVGIQLVRGGDTVTNLPKGWTSEGGYVTLKNGEAYVDFTINGSGAGNGGHYADFHVCIKNHNQSYAPEIISGGDVTVQSEVGVPFSYDLRNIFADPNGDALNYEISINGGEAKTQKGNYYRYTPTKTGDTVLTVKASDAFLSTETVTITITALDDHVWENWIVIKSVSCLEDGEEKRTCVCCGASETRAMEASGEHSWGDWHEIRAAACGVSGKDLRACSFCGVLESKVSDSKPCYSKEFTDLDTSADCWYHEGVDFMLSNGYMKGMDETTFAPDGDVSRAQLVTILYRIEGEPSVDGMENPFTDLTQDWYKNAVIWAENEGIVKGVSEAVFAPDAAISREQIAAILYRYDGASASSANNLKGFADGNDVSTYAIEAMNWAVGEGLINGVTEGENIYLNAQGTATRAQIATILFRYCQ